MYIKKIVVAIAVLGLVAVGGFSYYIYQTIFGINTALGLDFQNQCSFGLDVRKQIQKLLPCTLGGYS